MLPRGFELIPTGLALLIIISVYVHVCIFNWLNGFLTRTRKCYFSIVLSWLIGKLHYLHISVFVIDMHLVFVVFAYSNMQKYFSESVIFLLTSQDVVIFISFLLSFSDVTVNNPLFVVNSV